MGCNQTRSRHGSGSRPRDGSPGRPPRRQSPQGAGVLDVHSPEFAAEARRQSLLTNASPEEAEIQAFIDSVTEWPDDETTQ
jgi:hypothetical protein